METDRARRLGSFLVGGVVGGVAALVAAGRMRVKEAPPERPAGDGLAAFEGAPCYRELVEREDAERGDDGGRW